MTLNVPSTAQRGLVSRLTELRRDRAALAALRRGLGRPPGTVAEMYPYVEPFLGPDASRPRIAALYLVASLFGLHPLHADGPDGAPARRGLGATLRAVRFRPDSRDEDPGVTRRFTALLSADREALPEHVRHLVTLLRSRADHVAIDYRQLIRDVSAWDAVDRRVQRAWAAGFWAYQPDAESDASLSPTDTDVQN